MPCPVLNVSYRSASSVARTTLSRRCCHCPHPSGRGLRPRGVSHKWPIQGSVGCSPDEMNGGLAVQGQLCPLPAIPTRMALWLRVMVTPNGGVEPLAAGGAGELPRGPEAGLCLWLRPRPVALGRSPPGLGLVSCFQSGDSKVTSALPKLGFCRRLSLPRVWRFAAPIALLHQGLAGFTACLLQWAHFPF